MIALDGTWSEQGNEPVFAGLGHLKASNLKNHLGNHEREAGFAGCDDLAEAPRYVLGSLHSAK